MSDRFLVEFERRAVGVAVRVAGGFRFFASDPEFRTLEGSVFPRVRSLMGQVTRAGRTRRRRSRPLSPQPA